MNAPSGIKGGKEKKVFSLPLAHFGGVIVIFCFSILGRSIGVKFILLEVYFPEIAQIVLEDWYPSKSFLNFQELLFFWINEFVSRVWISWVSLSWILIFSGKSKYPFNSPFKWKGVFFGIFIFLLEIFIFNSLVFG